MTDADIDAIYAHAEALSTAADPAQLKDPYLAIVAGAQGSQKAKQLTAQLIPTYFHHFADQAPDALTAMLDLCEDSDMGTRVQAIRGLPAICRNSVEHLDKMADVLAQMLHTDESLELEAVRKSLVSLLRIDPIPVLKELFKQIESPEKALRIKAINLVRERVMPLHAELFDAEKDKVFAELVQKAIGAGVSLVEFKVFYTILQKLSVFKSADGAKALLECILPFYPGWTAPYDTTDDSFNRLVLVMTIANGLYPKGASPSGPINYFSEHVLSQYALIPDAQKLPLFKLYAEGCVFAIGSMSRLALDTLYGIIKTELELPAEGDASADDSNELFGEDQKPPKAKFALVEALLFAFHHLARRVPGSLNELCGIKIKTGQLSDFKVVADAAEKRADLNARLNRLLENTKAYAEKCSAAATKIKTDGDTEKDKKLSAIADARHVNNSVQNLAKALLKDPPHFIGNDVFPSWKPKPKAAQVRKAPEQGGQQQQQQQQQGNKRAKIQGQKRGNQQQQQQQQQQGRQQQQQQGQQEGQGRRRRRRR